MRKATIVDSMDIFITLWFVCLTLVISFLMWVKYLPETVNMILHGFPFGFIIIIVWIIILFWTFFRIKGVLNIIGELYFDKSEVKNRK